MLERGTHTSLIGHHKAGNGNIVRADRAAVVGMRGMVIKDHRVDHNRLAVNRAITQVLMCLATLQQGPRTKSSMSHLVLLGRN